MNRKPKPKKVAGGGQKPPSHPSPAAALDLPIAPDAAVKVAYRLFDEAGALHDEITKGEPLSYVHGYAQIIPGLEVGLEGARRGERRSLVLEPDEAFGERDPEARLEIDRKDFPSADAVAVGDEILCTAPDGSECAYRIVEVTETEIIADCNHPLAGARVRFEVEVLSVRKATDDEVADAMADMDERIVYADSIGYSTTPVEDAPQGELEPPLVQLRRNPKAGSTA